MKSRRSTVGMSGFPGIYGYASTKGAIEALTPTLAIELAPCGITVNLVHPPLTRTPSSATMGKFVGSRAAAVRGSNRG